MRLEGTPVLVYSLSKTYELYVYDWIFLIIIIYHLVENVDGYEIAIIDMLPYEIAIIDMFQEIWNFILDIRS